MGRFCSEFEVPGIKHVSNLFLRVCMSSGRRREHDRRAARGGEEKQILCSDPD